MVLSNMFPNELKKFHFTCGETIVANTNGFSGQFQVTIGCEFYVRVIKKLLHVII